MKLISKLIYLAHRKGLDIDTSDGVKITNIISNRYIHILPNGRICSNDILGQDTALKSMMNDFLIEEFGGSFLALPNDVTLHIGKGTSKNEIIFAKHCLEQCFAKITNFKVKEDDNLLPTECRIEHEYVLSFKKRQAFIKACLEYLK